LIKSVFEGITSLVLFFERNEQNGYVAFIFETIKDPSSNFII